MSGRADDAARYGAVATSVAAAIPAAFGIGPGGALVGALERSAATDLDAAVIEYFTLDVARDLNDDVAEATLTALEALRLPSGGYRRSASGDAYAAGEWAFVNLRMASLQARRGSLDAARTLIDLTVRRAAANFGLVPETYGVAPADPIGSYTGSVPMVGYGAGLLVLALMDLAEATISR